MPAACLLAAAGCSAPATSAAIDAGEGPATIDAGAEVAADAEDARDAVAEDAASLCPDGVAAPYPAGGALALLATIPDLAFDGLDEAGVAGPVALHDDFAPCAPEATLLVVRTSAAWCGTCRWDVAHTHELAASDVGPRLRWLDLLVANEDGLPAAVEDLAAWRARIDPPGRVAADPGFSLGPLDDAREALPFVALVDRRTMTIRWAGGDPDPDWLATRVRQELADLDGVPAPEPEAAVLHDGRFSRKQWDLLHEMTLPGAPPPDPTNAHADDPAAAALGAALFADATLSASGTVACATCHDPAQGFADGRPQSRGAALGDRNAPSVLFAAHARWQLWDGRADTLWAQALGPIENPKEMASTRLSVAHAIFDRSRGAYEAIFGPLPPLDDAARFPASGAPGDAAWQAMAAADRDAATRVFVNVGKAIAAYERTLRAEPNRLDAYVGGNLSALADAEKTGLKTFFTAGCAQCHWGPRLTDDAFHALRFPTGRQDGAADRGRIDAFALLGGEFAATGPYGDDPAAVARRAPASPPASLLGAFKTPALRGVAATAPYGHGGSVAQLGDLLALYAAAGLPASDPRAVGTTEPWVAPFSPLHAVELAPLLQLLTAEPAP